MEDTHTQDTQRVNLAIKITPELHQLIRKAAHRREMSLAAFVRLTLKEAAEFYARES
jgi:uncharacterized protein (DUF1778 family)